MNDIVRQKEYIFEMLRNDFSDLWAVKSRQNTVEFITPYTAMSGEAISVFVTQRDAGFVVSDGGRLFDIAEEQAIDPKANGRVHYADIAKKFGIKETVSSERRRFCYKIATDIKMLSASVCDVAYFLEAVSNAIYLETLFEKAESNAARYFAKRVRDTLHSKIQKTSATGKYELFRDDKLHLLKFATGVRKVGTESMWLGMAIHRSNIQNYERSVMSADFGFRRAGKYLPGADLFMSAVVDVLPDELRNNHKAGFLQSEMNMWKDDLKVTSLSLTEIDDMQSPDWLFKKAS